MKKTLCFILSLLVGTMLFAAEIPLEKFRLAPGAKLSEDDAGNAILTAQCPPCKDGNWHSCQSTFSIDMTPYRGKRFCVRCEYKLDGVKKQQVPYLGAKFMLVYTDSTGKYYKEPGIRREGSSDWEALELSVFVPEKGLDKAELSIGLQSASGTAQFRSVSMGTFETYKISLPENFRCEYDERVTNLPVHRGAMSPPCNKVTVQDIRDLGSWNANLMRWQVSVPKDCVMDPVKYKQAVAQNIEMLKKLLPEFRKAGIAVIYDIHSLPGGRMSKNVQLGTAGTLAKNAVGSASFRMFFEKKYFDCFVETWQMIARALKNEDQVVFYDLMNEPDQTTRVDYDYLQIQYETAKAIRAIDAEKIIMVTSNNWGNSPAYLQLQPLPLKNVIYTVHMYYPGSFTHQGVHNRKDYAKGGLAKAYPGVIDGQKTDREALKNYLSPVREFQLKYGARILVGEFSAIRWAPGAEKYLADVISIFEEYHWDWCYHAFREWDGWSVEHGENFHDRKKSPVETARKRVLLNGFKNNKK